MDRRARVARSVGRLVDLVQRRPDVLEGEIELVVCRIQVVEDALERGIGLDVVPEAEDEPVRDVDEDGHLVEVVSDGLRIH